MVRINEKLKKIVRPPYYMNKGYIFRKPIEHIAAGFLFEKGSGGYYIWRYALPLYDGITEPHLTYGERLFGSDGFLESENPTVSDLDQFLHTIVATYEREILKSMTLSGFLESLGGGNNRNIFAEFAEICTRILVGEGDAIGSLFESVRSSGRMSRYEDLNARSELLSSEFSKGINFAKALLLDWESKAKAQWSGV